MIYRAVSVEMVCDSEVPEERARLVAAKLAHVVRAAAYSWIAVQSLPDGVDFVVDGERVKEPRVLDLQMLAPRDHEANVEFSKLMGQASATPSDATSRSEI